MSENEGIEKKVVNMQSCMDPPHANNQQNFAENSKESWLLDFFDIAVSLWFHEKTVCKHKLIVDIRKL